MSYILGIAVGHNASTTLMKDGEIVFHIEEERLSRTKRDGNPFSILLQIPNFTTEIDTLVLTSTTSFDQVSWNGGDYYSELLKKIGVNVKEIIDGSGDHHNAHAFNTFYNSGFEDSIVVVIDGAGSVKQEQTETDTNTYFEAETIFRANYGELITQYQNFITNQELNNIQNGYSLLQNPTIVKIYEGVTQFLGWHPIEAGKTMGLAAYGKWDDRIPDLFDGNNRGKGNIFQPNYPATSIIKEDTGWYQFQEDEQFKANLARKVQFNSEYLSEQLIRKAIALNPDCKNICIGGGYVLNVINNGKLLKKFPDYNFWFEPTGNDAGNSIGVAKHIHLQTGGKKEDIQGIKDYFLGFEYNYDNLKVEDDNWNISKENNIDKVAELINNGEIVAIHQGRSEAGPRALGNRSFMMHPGRENGKDFMNKIKKREYFRPFAASVLEECAHEWFDIPIGGISPYMMVAFDTKEDKKDKIQAVVHEDGTTRIQTVSNFDDNPYRDIIEKFYEKSGIPLILNTSYNLSGEPLCETIQDSINTFNESDFDHIYLGDLDILISKKGKN